MNFNLREARPADAAAMLAIYAPYVEKTNISWEYETPSLQEFATRVAAHQQDGFPWLVAQDEQRNVLGYAYAGRFGGRKGFDWDAECSVYLSEAARGNHIGTALYELLLQILKKQGYAKALALLTYPNEASAAFHKKLGFQEEARLDKVGYKNGEWRGLSYYTLTLNELENPKPPKKIAEIDLQDILK